MLVYQRVGCVNVHVPPRLVVVDNAAVLHTVRTRYKRTDIYTFATSSGHIQKDLDLSDTSIFQDPETNST